YSLKLAKIKLSEDWEDFVSLLRSEYATWQKCQINVELMKNKVKTVEDQLALVKKQVKVGLSEELDLVQMEQKLEGYKIMLEQAELACETQTRKILQMMGQASGSVAGTKPGKFQINGQIMDEATATSYLVSSSNIKKTADILVDLQTADLETKEDAKKMDVSLVLSTKPNAFTEGFTDSISKIGTYSDNTITIKASRPLGNDKAEADAEQAKLKKTKAEKQRENIMLNSSIGLSSLYTNLQRLDNMIKLSQRNMKLAEQRLALEKKKFNQGRNSVFFVLQAEDDVLQAANSLNETVFAREAVINQIKTLTDRYLVEYKDILKL
ncbi:MAG: TolC family protein, partial [Candidatus Margulisiibacteriota bacterium]